MARHKAWIAVRCADCDQLHVADYTHKRRTALGPVKVYAMVCPITDTRTEYDADEEVVVP